MRKHCLLGPKNNSEGEKFHILRLRIHSFTHLFTFLNRPNRGTMLAHSRGGALYIPARLEEYLQQHIFIHCTWRCKSSKASFEVFSCWHRFRFHHYRGLHGRPPPDTSATCDSLPLVTHCHIGVCLWNPHHIRHRLV